MSINIAQWIMEVPPNAEQNDISLEVTPFERGGGMHEIGYPQFSEYRRVDCIFAIFATQPKITAFIIFLKALHQTAECKL